MTMRALVLPVLALALAGCMTLRHSAPATSVLVGKAFNRVGSQGERVSTPVRGARISVPGTRVAAVTGADGGFVLHVPTGKAVELLLTAAGQDTVPFPEIAFVAGDTVDVSIEMQPTPPCLEGWVCPVPDATPHRR
jgi:hypothetical protein